MQVTCFCSGPLFPYAFKLLVFHPISKCLWDFQDCVDLGKKIQHIAKQHSNPKEGILLRLQQLFLLKIDKQTSCCYLPVPVSSSESLNELNTFDLDISVAFVLKKKKKPKLGGIFCLP